MDPVRQEEAGPSSGGRRRSSQADDAKRAELTKAAEVRRGSADKPKNDLQVLRGKFVAFAPGRQIPPERVDLDKTKKKTGGKGHHKKKDPTLPYWEIELLKGAQHLRRHEVDFRKYKLRQRRIAEWIRRKSSIYITSGGEDLSIRSFASVYDGPVPEDVSPALTLLNGIEKLMLLPKALVSDYFCAVPWNSNMSRFFVLMDTTGHNRLRLEEVRHRCSKPELFIFDTFLHHKLGRIQRRGMSLKRRAGMDVFSPVSHFVGSVDLTWKCRPTFHVKDENGSLLFIIRLDTCRYCSCRTNVENISLTIKSPGGTEQGQIRADWDDLTYILYLSRKLYGVSFPLDMNVVHKLLLATANILVVSDSGTALSYYAIFEGKISKQVIHIQKDATKEYIEYQVLCGNDNDACLDGLSTVSSGSDTEVVRPLVDMETAR